MNSAVTNLFYWQFYSLINLTCQACKISLVEFTSSCPFIVATFLFLSFSSFPSPPPFLVGLGVSAQNNNNDHASMSVSIPAWLLQHYAAVLQAVGNEKHAYIWLWKLPYSSLVGFSGTCCNLTFILNDSVYICVLAIHPLIQRDFEWERTKQQPEEKIL